MVLELNASDDRGIDVVREQIKTFASTKQIFTMGRATGGGKSALAGYKLIILDEADAMTNTAQMALRRIMEKYTANTRFCIIANYAHKLSPGAALAVHTLPLQPAEGEGYTGSSGQGNRGGETWRSCPRQQMRLSR